MEDERGPETRSPLAAPATKACRWCGTEIPAQAVICLECKKYQSSLRELTLYVASIAGILTLLVSVFTFAVSNTIVLYRDLFQKNSISLAYLAVLPGRLGVVVIANNGTRPIFVGTVTISWLGGSYVSVFETTIPPSEFRSVRLPDEGSWQFKGAVGNSDGLSTPFLQSNTETDARSSRKCFVTYFYSQDADDLKRMNERYQKAGSRLVIEPAKLDVVYFENAGAEAKHLTIEGATTFYQRDPNSCNVDLVPRLPDS